jgi:hypothetical protein
MAVAYEVWDMETFNRVGSFSTLADAEAFLGDVLRGHGPEGAAAMAIVQYPPGSIDPVMVLEGADFVARRAAPV